MKGKLHCVNYLYVKIKIMIMVEQLQFV